MGDNDAIEWVDDDVTPAREHRACVALLHRSLRSVAVIIDGHAHYLTPEVARQVAEQLVEAADELDQPDARAAWRARRKQMLHARLDGMRSLVEHDPAISLSATFRRDRAEIDQELADLEAEE